MNQTEILETMKRLRCVCQAPDSKTYYAAIGLLWHKGKNPQKEQFAYTFSFEYLPADSETDIEDSRRLIKTLEDWGILWTEANRPWIIISPENRLAGKLHYSPTTIGLNLGGLNRENY